MELKEIKGTNHYLYDSIEEFNAFNDKVAINSDWRDAEEGDWVLTDDMHVVQVLKKFSVKGKDCIRTLCGTFKLASSHKMLGEDGIAENIYSFSGKNSDITKATPRKKLFAQYIATGTDVLEAYRKVYPAAKSESYIKDSTTKLLKTKEIQSMIKDEIKKCLEAEGVTPEWIIGRYKTIADVADRDTDRLRSLESLSKISGMFDTAEKKTEQLTVFAGFTPEQLEEVKNGKTELLAHKERESEG
jgi:hypothetical protein